MTLCKNAIPGAVMTSCCRPFYRRLALLFCLLPAFAGCAFTPPEQAPVVAQPKTLPVRTITSFSESLQCMDDLFTLFGKHDIVITSQGIPDATGQISTGSKEMLISAVSRMSAKSRALSFVDFDQSQTDINQLQGLIGFTEEFTVPNYYIRGAITQLDENVISENVGGSISLNDFGVGASADQIISVISVDLNVGDLLSRQILPGISANNSMAVRRSGIGGDAGGEIGKAGVSFNISFGRNEGMHRAVRTLIELSVIEVLGQLTQVPYWRCLQIEQTNPEMVAQARGWYARMGEGERVRFVQRALRAEGLYGGPIDGVLDAEVREALGAYQADRALLADGRINFDTYAAMINGDLALGREPQSGQPGPAYIPTSASTQPVALQLSSPNGPRPVYAPGQKLELRVRPSQDAFSYCYYRDGTGSVARIFPNRFQPNSRIAAGQTINVPSASAGFEIVFERPGREEVRCIASDREIGLELPVALQAEDLSPLPIGSLDELVGVFRAAGDGRITEARLPIIVN